MKNPISRILIRSVIFTLLAGGVIVIIGLTAGWKTYTQFSDGFFWVGAILISMGLLSVMGGYYTASSTQYSESMSRLDSAERARRWVEDAVQSHKAFVFLGLSGLMLLGLAEVAIVIGRML